MPTDVLDWRLLESNSNREDIQALIGQAIREGMIRVLPAIDGGIHIVPEAIEGRVRRSARRLVARSGLPPGEQPYRDRAS